ncbi:methyltransferase domain-containing protein [Mycena alexandri]|uniref:Methyltransferase domain-containing protein n=1 Tax=Mycena alexandri TaxID=1745969 RepID=A0AAD6TB60_9AGAR|nr:methyltransferase domain-containing protein [Mycena alexandri]
MSRFLSWQLPVIVSILLTMFLLARHHAPPGTLSALNTELSTWAFPRPESRLNQTLAANEMRYKAAMKQRRRDIASSGGEDRLSFPEPDKGPAGYTLWDFFLPAFSCPFPVHRVGTLGDGGKWVCGLERAVGQPECVVYSMGVERQSSFEQAVLHQAERCHVYGFDFSVSKWGPELLADTAVNDRAHFFPYKIGATDDHDASPKQYTFRGIMKELGHSFVDIWKIDIEGSEFPTILAIIESFNGEPLPFGQMQIEIHIGYTADAKNTIRLFQDWWTKLEDAGLRPFWTELNLPYVNYFRRGPFVAEWSFINIRGKHALIDDSLPDYP